MGHEFKGKGNGKDFWNSALIKYEISLEIIKRKYDDENLELIYETIISEINKEKVKKFDN